VVGQFGLAQGLAPDGDKSLGKNPGKPLGLTEDYETDSIPVRLTKPSSTVRVDTNGAQLTLFSASLELPRLSEPNSSPSKEPNNVHS
jgi:hypothetical protein